MEILKKISKNKLIIMVTHNSELAEKYSSRIVKILDGKITDDSNPINSKEKEKNKEQGKFKRTSMNFFTAIQLSLNNLLTKKGRTILTSFAGSIGIIGIALILAISTGVQGYIDKVEEDTLSSYPITIEESTIDMNSMMETMMGEAQTEQKEREESKIIYSVDIMDQMMSLLSNEVENNNLTELKKYIEGTDNAIKSNSNAIQYNYNLNINLYKPDTSEKIVRVNPSTVLDTIGMEQMRLTGASSISGTSSMGMSTGINAWTEMLDNDELLKTQYDLVSGKWPESYNEVVLIVSENNEISDYVLYTLGLKDQQELVEQMNKIDNGQTIEKVTEISYTFEELLDLKYKLILNSDYYNKENGIWVDKSEDDEFMKAKIQSAEEIKIVGIIKPNEQSLAMAMQGGIGYTKQLKEYVINKSNEAQIVKEQVADKNINVFSGLEFPKDGENKSFNYSSLSTEQKIKLSQLSSEELAKVMEAYSENANASYDTNMIKLAAIDLESPAAINIYPKDFDSKENIVAAIEDYNQKQKDDGKEENTITYTDLVGVMIKSVSRVVDIISYVLIAFVAVSLIVSSIMIGIITYISVLERTKEIGILRAIGVSKKDVARIFNAETLIVGLIAGLIGTGVTVLLTIPINHIVLSLTGVAVTTRLPFIAGIILVCISVILTMIGGLIPSRLASKKDPVIALRTE